MMEVNAYSDIFNSISYPKTSKSLLNEIHLKFRFEQVKLNEKKAENNIKDENIFYLFILHSAFTRLREIKSTNVWGLIFLLFQKHLQVKLILNGKKHAFINISLEVAKVCFFPTKNKNVCKYYSSIKNMEVSTKQIP